MPLRWIQVRAEFPKGWFRHSEVGRGWIYRLAERRVISQARKLFADAPETLRWHSAPRCTDWKPLPWSVSYFISFRSTGRRLSQNSSPVCTISCCYFVLTNLYGLSRYLVCMKSGDKEVRGIVTEEPWANVPSSPRRRDRCHEFAYCSESANGVHEGRLQVRVFICHWIIYLILPATLWPWD
jgi:hypothetical protein